MRRTVFLAAIGLCLTLAAAWAQEEPEPAGPPMDAGKAISADFSFASHYVDVLDSKMHYVDVGEGEPVLFLHGNPTSSYLWRNIIPYLSDEARCIAPDLIGMGKSGKPDVDYTFFDHARYLDAFIEQLGLEDITLVIHDWGSGLGFHYAKRNPDNVQAIAFMEGMVKPWETWEEFPALAAPMFKQWRTPDVGWELLGVQNMFVEQVLPMATNRELREEEMDYYRAPFEKEADRKPVWQWPNQVPIAGEPADVVKAVEAYSEWLQRTEKPKLLLHVTPGVLIPEPTAQWCKDNMKNLTAIHLGPGSHYIQEDYPHTIGQHLKEWYAGL